MCLLLLSLMIHTTEWRVECRRVYIDLKSLNTDTQLLPDVIIFARCHYFCRMSLLSSAGFRFRFLLPDPKHLLWWIYHLQCWINISSHFTSSSPKRLQKPQQHPPSSPCGICKPAGGSIIHTASPELTLTSPPVGCVWRTSVLIRRWLFYMWRKCWSPHPVRRLNPNALLRSLASINLIFHSLPKSSDGREQEGEQTINQAHTLSAQEMTSQQWHRTVTVLTLPERHWHQSYSFQGHTRVIWPTFNRTTNKDLNLHVLTFPLSNKIYTALHWPQNISAPHWVLVPCFINRNKAGLSAGVFICIKTVWSNIVSHRCVLLLRHLLTS